MIALLHFGGEDYQCAIRTFTDANEYNKFKQQVLAEKASSTTIDDKKTKAE